jgi:putative iron-only hydrogenase system regulator
VQLFLLREKGRGELKMETRVAIIGIIVEKNEAAEPLNAILHEYGSYIVGRMGIPYRRREISILSVAVDAPQDVISTLSGRIGQLDGVSAKTAYSNVISKE